MPTVLSVAYQPARTAAAARTTRLFARRCHCVRCRTGSGLRPLFVRGMRSAADVRAWLHRGFVEPVGCAGGCAPLQRAPLLVAPTAWAHRRCELGRGRGRRCYWWVGGSRSWSSVAIPQCHLFPSPSSLLGLLGTLDLSGSGPVVRASSSPAPSPPRPPYFLSSLPPLPLSSSNPDLRRELWRPLPPPPASGSSYDVLCSLFLASAASSSTPMGRVGHRALTPPLLGYRSQTGSGGPRRPFLLSTVVPSDSLGYAASPFNVIARFGFALPL
jgi:hypothetical protein